MLVTAENKKQFIKAWYEHVDSLIKLASNFEGEMFSLIYARIESCKDDLKDIIREAAEELDK